MPLNTFFASEFENWGEMDEVARKTQIAKWLRKQYKVAVPFDISPSSAEAFQSGR